MPYKSQDFQQLCAQFLKERHPPHGFIEALEKYNPRFGHLMRGHDRAVFDSDIEHLANFLQNTPEGLAFTPNRFVQSAHLQSQFHKKMREYNILREVAPQFERKSKKLEIIQRVQQRQRAVRGQMNLSPEQQEKFRRLEEQQKRILDMAQQQEELKKRRANIKTARKKTTRLERAKSYVEELVQSRRDALKSKQGGRMAPIRDPRDRGGGIDLAI